MLWTWHGTDFTARLPRVAEAVRSLPVETALLDGEAVVFKPDGHSDFEAFGSSASIAGPNSSIGSAASHMCSKFASNPGRRAFVTE